MNKLFLALIPLAFACQDAPAPAEEAHDHAGHDHAGHDHAAHDHGEHKDMEHGHSFADVDKWSAIFDAPERDAWQKPAELVAALEIAAGSTVADIGAGTGYFEPHLATAVGTGGTVIATDSEPNMVEHMKTRFGKEGAPKVDVRLSTAADDMIADGEADLMLLVNTYHHITDRPAFFAALATGLALDGRLAVVDYKPGSLTNGPPPEMRIDPEKVKAELEGSGWTQLKTLDELPEQYVLIFGVAEEPAQPAEPAAE